MEVIEDQDVPGQWRVEFLDVDGEGGVLVVIFAGVGAEAAARRYCGQQPPAGQI